MTRFAFVKLFLFVMFSTLIVFISSNLVMANDEFLHEEPDYVKARVLKMINEQYDYAMGGGMVADIQVFQAQVLSGERRGFVLEAENTSFGNPAYDLWVKEGDKVIIVLEKDFDGEIRGYLVDHVRETQLIILVFVFIGLLLIIGRYQGLKAVITLGLTLLIIARFMMPLLFDGHNPVLLALITGMIVSSLTFLIIGGWSKKSLASIVGTVGGLATAALISILVTSFTRLNGLSDEEAQMLLYIPQAVDFDFRGLLMAGIIIGALGAVMDVSMSIASAMEEIYKKSQNISFRELYRSGMNVGKDIMGTMSNTLILAYTGTSIPLLLLLMAYEQPFMKLINMEFLATEVVRSMAGSIGLILAIPITALVSAFLLKLYNKDELD